MQKILEGANIKLSSVVSNILGVTSRKMLQALINDDEETDIEVIASFAKGKMKGKVNDIAKALNGLVGHHQKMIIADQLEHIDFLTNKIEQLDTEVETRMLPFFDIIVLADTIAGIGDRAAQDILAEIGTDMDRFPTANHLLSWAGMSPGNNKSAA